MHSIKNILERNKIDSQSRADTYIRRTRLISKSDAPKSIHETEKNPKNPLVWAKKTKKTQKKPKNPKKPKKTQKTQKNPLGWVFLKKPGFFPTL